MSDRLPKRHWSEAYRDPERAKRMKRESTARYRAANRELVRARARKFQSQNLEYKLKYWREHGFWHWLRRQYGISKLEYENLLNAQDGKCAICSCAPKRFHVDHNHKTRKLRGLLCSNCNRGIGHLQDNPEVLRKAVEYLERYCG